MKTLKFLALCLVGVFGLYSCGNDDKDEKKEEQNKVYLVKSISCTFTNGYFFKFTFTYDNGKITKFTAVDSDGETSWRTYTYSSANSINVKDSEGSEGVITMNSSENVISKYESSNTFYNENTERYENESITFSFMDGYLSKYSYSENTSTCLWADGFITSIKNTEYEGNHTIESSTSITYSDVKNNTNIDFFLFFEEGEDLMSFSQFIKNVSKNIPSSYKTDSGSLYTVTTTLDEKGRPAKMVIDGEAYTFEYYE